MLTSQRVGIHQLCSFGKSSVRIHSSLKLMQKFDIEIFYCQTIEAKIVYETLRIYK